jgi:hypothetical protein
MVRPSLNYIMLSKLKVLGTIASLIIIPLSSIYAKLHFDNEVCENLTYRKMLTLLIMNEFHPAWTVWSTVAIVVYVKLSFDTSIVAPFMN